MCVFSDGTMVKWKFWTDLKREMSVWWCFFWGVKMFDVQFCGLFVDLPSPWNEEFSRKVCRKI